MMHRFLFKNLESWHISKHRKPLILQGARQVGKTYLIKEFAKEKFRNYIYCNFEKDRTVSDFFKNSLEPKKVIELLSIYFKEKIHPEKTLIIFDEVQECGTALTSLKYFYEEAKQVPLIAAGSLLGVTLAETSSFPVGMVDFLELYPLSFNEFIYALGEQELCKYIVDFKFKEPLPQAFAVKLEILLAKYQVIGGMPEAVQRYIETESFTEARAVQESILKSYVNDFAKHAPRDEVAEILEVWQVIPIMLAKENKKFVFSEIKKGERLEKYSKAIIWLIQAGVVIPAKRIGNPRSPLAAQVDPKFFKLYHNDAGLLAARLNIDVSLVAATENLLGEYSGALAENFVAQELSTQNKQPLYYWASRGSAEVDFILETPKKIVPLEVKARRNIHSKSLTTYIQKYQPELALRVSLKNYDRQNNVANLPLYMIGTVKTLLG